MLSHRRVTVRFRRGALLLCTLWMLLGCAERLPSHVSPHYAQHKPTHIAVMPIRNHTGKPLTAPPSRTYIKTLLEWTLSANHQTTSDVSVAWRRKIQHALHQKAYHVLPLEVVDAGVPTPQVADSLPLPATQGEPLSGIDGLLYSTITAWDTRRLKTDNTIIVAASFLLVHAESKKVLWEAAWPYGSVAIKATQPWHDIRYYIARVVDTAFATLPSR